MINNNKGFCLFHVIFIVMLVINIFIYILLHNLNRNNYFRDKDKYYQVFIYEERAKRHINERFSVNQPSNNETELLYFDENYIYFLYKYNYDEEIWCINYRISYNDINQIGIIYYNCITNDISIEIQ